MLDMTILIVEDDAGLSELIKEAIEEIGCISACAFSAESAFSYLESHSPDLAILDYRLPDMNAKEFISELEKHNKIVPPFIVSTGQGDERIAVQMMKLGARDYIVKDRYFLEMLPDVIKRVCNEIENENKRKRAEDDLKDSELKYHELYSLVRLLSDTMPDMIWAKNLKKEFIFANNSICENLLSAENTNEPIGKTDLFFANRERERHPDNPQWHTFGELCQDSDEITLKEMKVMQFEEFGNVKGKYLFLDVQKAPLYNKAGELIGVVGAARDFTERKAAESALLESEEKYRMLFNANKDSISILATDDNGFPTHFLEMNDAASEIFGYSKNELISQNLVNLETDVPVEIILERMGKLKANGVVDFETVIKDKARRDRIIEVKVISINYRNRPALLNISRDITERKRSENELKVALKRAEESDKLKTAFLQNLSHEIRTPLNGILGFSNLLTNEDLSKEEIQEFTGIIRQSGNRLMEIVNNVLDISKIETGLITLNNKAFTINSLIADLCSFFNPNAVIKGIKLNYSNALDDNSSIIYSDESKINQILTNLIGNAIKFSNDGDIEFGYKIVEDKILFYVKDSGVGIHPEMFERIFDRFTQVDLSITRGYEGAGLGLAICKGLVELLGGKIWLESEIDKGTTFYFTVPFINAPPIANIPIEENTNNIKPHKTKVLIAEDDRTCYWYIKNALKNRNCDLIWAQDGEEAVEIVKSDPDIELIFMDMKMPIMDGFEATRIIKGLRPDLPIIAQTAYAFSEEKEEILAIGCDDYLSKPIEHKKLMAFADKYIK